MKSSRAQPVELECVLQETAGLQPERCTRALGQLQQQPCPACCGLGWGLPQSLTGWKSSPV